MKPGSHPEISAASRPFWTGKQWLLDTAAASRSSARSTPDAGWQVDP